MCTGTFIVEIGGGGMSLLDYNSQNPAEGILDVVVQKTIFLRFVYSYSVLLFVLFELPRSRAVGACFPQK